MDMLSFLPSYPVSGLDSMPQDPSSFWLAFLARYKLYLQKVFQPWKLNFFVCLTNKTINQRKIRGRLGNRQAALRGMTWWGSLADFAEGGQRPPLVRHTVAESDWWSGRCESRARIHLPRDFRGLTTTACLPPLACLLLARLWTGLAIQAQVWVYGSTAPATIGNTTV